MLKNKIEIWKNMPRNNPEELALADKFFDEELIPLAAEKFVGGQNKAGQYYGMFLTLGTSWEPLALSVMAIKPKKLCILGTADTMHLVPKIVEFAKLPEGSYELRTVDRSDVEMLYKAVCEFYKDWKQEGPCCIDITGGTKAMASGAAMFGASLGMDVYYVESKYLPLYRHPEPGSENLIKLVNPLKWLVREATNNIL